MAIITDAELEAGFQVRVRWYAQATQRYPSNENEYYSTFFNTLEPNEQFSLSDPRFDINAINDNPEDLQYVIRDVCHTQTLIPQFVDFVYINPDYVTYTTLNGRVDGGSTTIEVAANPDPNFMSRTLVQNQVIQIGPIQSDVYTIASVSGTTVTLTTPTTKTFANGSIVADSDSVDGRYPDTTAETALARILDNTGSLFTGTIQVTTPLYFDIGETVRRFYYDSALQTPYNGARGSGDTENLVVIDPRDITREVEAGWWASGDTDNEAAEEACLIDTQGFLIGKRDRAHAFQQILYYAQGENAACTANNPTLFLSNHPDFTDTGFTSIRNDDASLSLPVEGFYAWGSPTIIFTESMVTVFFGDNQFRPGASYVAPTDDDDPEIPDGSSAGQTVPSVTFMGQISGRQVEFTITDAARTPAGAALPDVDDSWEIDRTTIVDTEGTTTDLNGLVENLTSDRLATNRFVRYWTGTQFDSGRVHPTLLVDNCPTPLGLNETISHFDTQQNAACQNRGTTQTVWYTTSSSSNDNFEAGNVTAIFTDQFGFNSDEPSSLGVRYVRFNNIVYLWNGNSLSVDNAECISRFCADPNALNFQDLPGGIPDSSTCVYPRRICTNSEADNFVPLNERVATDITDNSTCIIPQPPAYTTHLLVTRDITGPAAGYRVSGDGAQGHLVGTGWTRTASVTANTGYTFTSGPTFSAYSPSQSGDSLADGESLTITVTVTGTVEENTEEPDPNSASYNYGTSANVACSVSGSLDTRTLYWSGNEDLRVGVRVFSDSGLTTSAATGYYAFALQTIFVTGGSVQTGFTACPVEPEPDPFTAPTNFSADVVGNPGGSGSSSNPYIMQASDTISFTYSFTDPDDLVTRPQVTVTRADLFNISQQTDSGVTISATSFPGSGLHNGAVIITGRYTNPDTGAIVSFGTETVYLRIQTGF